MKVKKFFPLVVISGILISCHGQKADLSLKLEKGKEYKQVTVSKAMVTQEINGQKINTAVSVSGAMSFFVEDVYADVYTMRAKFDKLGMTIQLPHGDIEFSSESYATNDIFSEILKNMKNKTFGVVMSKSGKVKQVNDVDAIWESVINQFPVSQQQKDQVKTQITKAYGTAALKGGIEMVTAIYPDTIVNKGDQWTVNTNLESGMSANVSTNYKFVDVTPGYNLIRGNSVMITADKDAYIESNGMPMKYDLTGTMTSELKVDKKTGWIREAKINQDIKGDAYFKENPQMPRGMRIPMTMVSEMMVTG